MLRIKMLFKNDPKKLLETLTEICFSQYQMRLNKDIDHAKSLIMKEVFY